MIILLYFYSYCITATYSDTGMKVNVKSNAELQRKYLSDISKFYRGFEPILSLSLEHSRLYVTFETEQNTEGMNSHSHSHHPDQPHPHPHPPHPPPHPHPHPHHRLIEVRGASIICSNRVCPTVMSNCQ